MQRPNYPSSAHQHPGSPNRNGCSSKDTPVPTSTPLPTETPVPTATLVPTATPTQTPDVAATKAALVKAENEKLSAGIKTQLEALELPTTGSLDFHSTSPITLTVTKFDEAKYRDINPGHTYSNFILGMQVMWKSKSGLAICGLHFRSNGDPDTGTYYMLETLRLSGLPLWTIAYVKDGDYLADIMGEAKVSSFIHQEQASVNEYILYADGNRLTVYANGKRMGGNVYEALTSGYLRAEAYHESGETTCAFNNIWVWQLP